MEINKRFVAVELFTAGICNLNCLYCYIPKSPKLSKIHKEIINKIENGSFIEELKNLYGDQLQCISHWGTEPTLTLNNFTRNKFYEKIIKTFPDFSEINLSSNFMTDPNILIDFISTFPEHEKPIKFKIQISLDGPTWITDKNRCNAASEKIVSNLYTFVKEINNISENLKKQNNYVDIHFKSTHYKDEIKKLTEMDKTVEYCDFFDDIVKNIYKLNENKGLTYSNNCAPTLVYPGTYEVQDGKNYDIYNRNFYNIYKSYKYKFAMFFPQVYNYFCETIKVCDIIHTNNAQVGCSAGRSQLALSHNKDIMACHRIFYMNDPTYDELFKPFFENNDYYYGYEQHRDELIKNFLIANDKENFNKMQYVYAGYHDFHQFKLSNTFSLIKEMSECGLISPQYKDNDKMTELLAIMVCRRECSVDNILTTSSMHIIPATSIKMFGNGAFDFYYNLFYEDKTCH